MTIDDIINRTIGVEGGYANDPKDAGGETMWGITVAVARRNGYAGPMKSMPRTTAFNIFKSEYVIKPAFDQIAVISLSVAGEMIDTGINMGVSVAGTFLQQSLNALNEAGLKEDGACGKQTRVALAAYINKRGPDAEVILLRALNVYQGAKYLGLTQTHPEDHRFINGWLLNRVVI